jgi:dTDP-4-amino-4,6-dideoxygalactose transaminase
MPLTLPWQHPDTYSALHLYVIRLNLDQIPISRKEVFISLQQQGIGVNVHYIPVHTQPVYKRMGFAVGDYPESEKYYAEAISLPIYAKMTDQQQDEVTSALHKALLP